MLRFAFRFITYDKAKSIGVVLGIVISTFLVGQQTGIFLFLTGAMASLVDNTRTDLWVVDNKTTNVNALGMIDVRVGRQLESIPGVRKAYPFIVTGGMAKFEAGQSSPVQIIGVQPPNFRGGPWRIINGRLSDLLEEGAVSVDIFERKNLNNAGMGTAFEINGRRAHIAVESRGVRGFGGIFMFTTVSRARDFGGLPSTKISAFLV
jgi:putative ABC transport system permease protein